MDDGQPPKLMQDEEIKLKLGVDGGAFATGLRKANSSLEELGVTGHHSFAHVGNKAREFHHVIERISESSPTMGMALKLALDPMLAIIAGIAMGFQYLTSQIEKFNELAKEAAEFGAKLMETLEKGENAAAKAMSEAAREHQKFVASHHDGTQAVILDLEKRQKAIEAEAASRKKAWEDWQSAQMEVIQADLASGKINTGQAQARIEGLKGAAMEVDQGSKTETLGAQKAAIAAAAAAAVVALEGGMKARIGAEAFEREAIERIGKEISLKNAKAISADQEAVNMQKWQDHLSANPLTKREAIDAAGEQVKTWKSIAAQNRREVEFAEDTLKRAKDRANQKREAETKLIEAVKKIAEAEQSNAMALSQNSAERAKYRSGIIGQSLGLSVSQMEGLIPTAETLANSGQWIDIRRSYGARAQHIFNRSPGGAAAEYMLRAHNQAMIEYVAGNRSGAANWERESMRVRRDLQAGGFIKKEPQDLMAELFSFLRGDNSSGVAVNPKMAP